MVHAAIKYLVEPHVSHGSQGTFPVEEKFEPATQVAFLQRLPTHELLTHQLSAEHVASIGWLFFAEHEPAAVR